MQSNQTLQHLYQKLLMSTWKSQPRVVSNLTVLLILLCTGLSLTAQVTRAYTEPGASLRTAQGYYDAGLYHAAYVAFDDVLRHHQGMASEALRQKASLGKAQSALRADLPDGERLMVDFITYTRPDPIANIAAHDIADFYFNQSNYDKAIAYFSMMRSADLTAEMLSEARFKQGYSHFVKKEFNSAEATLGEVRELKTVYYYPVNYYYGMCKFFKEDYDAALVSFEKVAQSEKYREYVPYYITQIYFARGEYDKLIGYASPRLEYAGVMNKQDIQLLLGRSYFETESYASALPYLENYANQAPTMLAGDFYQLAFSQYQAGEYAEATENFRQIAQEQNELGQRANFYLADCYLRIGDLQSARTAFYNVSKMDFDRELREEALLQYGKVSSQLHFDRDAIQALESISPSSRWRSEAQDALKNIFFHTTDYVTALDALSSMQTLSPALKEAFQYVSLQRGIQVMQDGNVQEADKMFRQVMTYPVNASASAQAMFWRAEIAHQQGRYEESADYLRQYFTLSKTAGTLPIEASLPFAHYLQGYNALHLRNFVGAQSSFTDAVALLKPLKQYQRTVFSDALVRAGDCAFKRNLYTDARKLYNDAVSCGGKEVVYAKYQTAIIEGLEHHPEAQARQLEALVNDHPESELADNALLQLGITYHEINKPEKAMQVLQRLLDKYPDSDLYVPTLLRLGLVAYNTGNSSAALTYYKNVFNHQPLANEAREALSALEEIYVSDLKTPDAFFDFVSRTPGYELSAMKKDSVSFRVAEIQYEQGSYPAAIKAFTEYLQRFPNGINTTSAHFYRGDAHAIQKQYGEALNDFDAVVKKGKSTYYLDALGRAALLSYHHTEDFDGALSYYSTLRELITDPVKRFEAELGILRSAYRAGKTTDVIPWSAQVSSSPHATEVVRSEAHYYGAKAAYQRAEYELSLEHFNQVISLSKNEQSAEARYLIARIYYESGQFDVAEQFCQQAIEHNAQYPYWVAKSLILLSDLAVEKDDLFNAKAPLEAVIENFTGDSALIAEAQKKLDSIIAMERQKSRVQQDTSKLLELQIIEDKNHE